MPLCRVSLTTILTRSWIHSHPRPRIRSRLKDVQSNMGVSRSFATTGRVQATHRDTPASSLLSQTLDQRQRLAKNSQADSVGPFTLGMVQQPIGANEPPLKKWKELDTKGKVMRTTARTTNLTVILFGAGLTVVLAYALTSELFARNSPTVLYGEACKRIKGSEEIAQFLPGSLTFHNNPPSAVRPRRRNHNVSSQLAVDSQGREHLLLNFFIRASPVSSASALSDPEGYVERIWVKMQTLGERTWTWEEVTAWAGDVYGKAKEKGRRLFWYLTGEDNSSSSASSSAFPSGSSPHTQHPSVSQRKETHIGRAVPDENGSTGLWSSFAGLFAGLGRGLGGSEAATDSAKSGARSWNGLTFDEAEVHCDLVKDESGNFVWRYILVDLPNSRGRAPTRVFVERSPDVREGEAVLRWY